MHLRNKTAMLVPKQHKNLAQVLHNDIVKFPKDFFAIVLSTNMAAAVTSGTIKEWRELHQFHSSYSPYMKQESIVMDSDMKNIF